MLAAVSYSYHMRLLQVVTAINPEIGPARTKRLASQLTFSSIHSRY